MLNFTQNLLIACILVSCLAVDVPTCTGNYTPNIYPFYYTDTGTIDVTTKAHMCHDDSYLYVRWFNVDQDIICPYDKCNDPLYNDDAVQIFLATKTSNPYHYFEIQLSPNSQLFIADITNLNLTCSGIKTNYYSCTVIEYSGQITSNGWNGYLKIDLYLIGRGYKQTTYIGNLFRIDRDRSKPTRYLAYNPSFNTPICFHQPLKFVQFNLV